MSDPQRLTVHLKGWGVLELEILPYGPDSNVHATISVSDAHSSDQIFTAEATLLHLIDIATLCLSAVHTIRKAKNET